MLLLPCAPFHPRVQMNAKRHGELRGELRGVAISVSKIPFYVVLCCSSVEFIPVPGRFLVRFMDCGGPL